MSFYKPLIVIFQYFPTFKFFCLVNLFQLKANIFHFIGHYFQFLIGLSYIYRVRQLFFLNLLNALIFFFHRTTSGVFILFSFYFTLFLIFFPCLFLFVYHVLNLFQFTFQWGLILVIPVIYLLEINLIQSHQTLLQ